MALVINGERHYIAEVESACFLDDRSFAFTDPKDYAMRPKGAVVKNICLHTRMGVSPQVVVDEMPNRRWDELVGRRISKDSRHASWHISIDADGSFVCHLDLATVKAYHAGQTNDGSIGIEMYQLRNGTITKATLETAVIICNHLTKLFGIQRQVPSERKISKRFANNTGGWHRRRKLAYIKGGERGTNFYGVFGHRNATRNRGKGDPGDEIFRLLEEEGYEVYDVDANQDRDVWKTRQRDLGLFPDGIPGPKTVAALKEEGHVDGLWVQTLKP